MTITSKIMDERELSIARYEWMDKIRECARRVVKDDEGRTLSEIQRSVIRHIKYDGAPINDEGFVHYVKFVVALFVAFETDLWDD